MALESDFTGDPVDDVAINVNFHGPAVWIVPGLVEFLDHDAGMTIGIAGSTFVRQADGSWEPKAADSEGASR